MKNKCENLFDRKELTFKKLDQRFSKTDITFQEQLDFKYTEDEEKYFKEILELIESNFVVLSFGAHLIKNKMGPVIIELMKSGKINHILSNGASAIHDWEFAYHGVTEEDVKENIMSGSFGMWEETGYYINQAINYKPKLGAGRSIGSWIDKENLNNKNLSVVWQAFNLEIPFSISVGIGQDIIHMHPSCDGKKLGLASYNDFLKLAYSLKENKNVLILNIGSAISGPMVVEKATSMARNISPNNIQRCVINDLFNTNYSWRENIPNKDNHEYYNRQLKTFSRIDEDFIYMKMDNRKFLNRLYKEYCL